MTHLESVGAGQPLTDEPSAEPATPPAQPASGTEASDSAADRGPGPREARLCLVLNGGVSLAVWMAGVTRTIDEMRTARAFSGDSAPRVAKAWNDILTAASVSRVTVDLVAGTSAGGLNGAVLATAVAAGRALPDMKELWVDKADLSVSRLVPSVPTKARSLLDGEFFANQVLDVLDGAAGRSSDGTSPGALLPTGTPTDCTLLVTATALSAVPAETTQDSLAARDSRRVYRFRHRQVPPPETAPEGWTMGDFTEHAADLALAGRASASFPAAFSPVFESEGLRSLRVVGEGPTSHLVDGGVLDNAPFEPLLTALRDRPVDGPFERYLVYVKPSVGSSAPPAAAPANPDLAHVLGRVIGASREPDERLDKEALDEAAQLMKFDVSRPHRLIAQGLGLVPDSSVSACGDKPDLASSAGRRGAFVALAKNGVMFDVYRRSRVEAARIVLEESGAAHPVALTCHDLPCLPYIPAAFGPPLPGERWDWGVSTASRLLRWWSRMLAERDLPLPDSRRTAPQDWAVLLGAQRRLTVLSESLRRTVTAASGDAPGALAAWYTDERTDDIREAVFAAAETVARNLGTDQTPLLEVSLAVEVAVTSTGWSAIDDLDVPRFTYVPVTPGARSLADLGPAGQEPRWSEKKLYGTQWGHFGAFATRDGREHDWLWGRLDGASVFADLFLAGVTDSGLRKRLEDELRDAILETEVLAPGGEALPTDAARASEVARRAAEIVRGPDQLFKRFAEELDADTRYALEKLLWSLVRKNLPSPVREYALAFLAPKTEMQMGPDDLQEGQTPASTPGIGTRVLLKLTRWYGFVARKFIAYKVRKMLDD